MTEPSHSVAPFVTAAAFPTTAPQSTTASDPLARFYAEYPPLAGELPHHNPQNGDNLVAMKVTCDNCSLPLPLETLHGVINDYAHCTEVRYVGKCPQCEQVMHNVLRMTGDELRFIQNGKWCVSTKRPWWHCLWPWPIDREWS